MNVHELQLDGVTNEQQLHAARWELFVRPEIRDVVLFVNGHVGILYEGEPDLQCWLGLLEDAGYVTAVAT